MEEPLGIVWFLSAPEDIIQLQIILRKIQDLGDGYFLICFNIKLTIIPFLNSHAGNYFTRKNLRL